MRFANEINSFSPISLLLRTCESSELFARNSLIESLYKNVRCDRKLNSKAASKASLAKAKSAFNANY